MLIIGGMTSRAELKSQIECNVLMIVRLPHIKRHEQYLVIISDCFMLSETYNSLKTSIVFGINTFSCTFIVLFMVFEVEGMFMVETKLGCYGLFMIR